MTTNRKELLGTVEGANLLIKELFLDLRSSVNEWSKITQQTPQARMGYVGQHLTSMVTGYPGGKSGARGYDIVLPDGYGEIKTCYRVDQLGACNDCGAVVSAMERECSDCGSSNIKRKDDSKWLIALRNDKEFLEAIEPIIYYLAIFEFEDLNDPSNIVASIYSVDPLAPGFALCMADYFLNIRANSSSKAPFNLWPYLPKFYLMKPLLIYKSIIKADNTIETLAFPGVGEKPALFDFSRVSRSSNITAEALADCLRYFGAPADVEESKNVLCEKLKELVSTKNISNDLLCDVLSYNIYAPLLDNHIDKLPAQYIKILKAGEEYLR